MPLRATLHFWQLMYLLRVVTGVLSYGVYYTALVILHSELNALAL